MNTDNKQSQMSICAVVTTFHPDEGFPYRISRVRGQVTGVIIVDDGATEENVFRLTNWFEEMPGVVLMHHSSNRGVAAALNTGLQHALNVGFSHALLLDDDSLVAPAMVDDLKAALETASIHVPAIVGACYNCPGTGLAVVDVERVKEVTTIITAGSLIPLQVFNRIGPFREDLFIDYVDHEYCLRARTMGVRILQSREARLEQPLGQTQKTSWGELRSVHSQSRTYYFFRNSLAVAREYAGSFPGFAFWTLWQQLKTLLKIVFFLRPKRQYMRAVVRGWSDGLARRMGPMAEGILQ